MPLKTSACWKYFAKGKKGVASCTLCRREIKYSGSTSNMIDHLRRKHNPAYMSITTPASKIGIPPPVLDEPFQEVEQEVDDPASMKPTPSSSSRKNKNPTTQAQTTLLSDQIIRDQHKVPNVLEPEILWQPGPAVQTCTSDALNVKPLEVNKINTLMVDWIAASMLPFRTIENESFKKLIYELEPRYTPPSRKTLTFSVLPERFLQIKAKLEIILQRSNHVALSTDLWTSVAMQGYLSVTSHFIVEGQIHSALLSVRYMPEQHTGEEIAKALKGVIAEWALEEKIFAIVTDNANSMVDATRRLGMDHHPCVAHTLNLVINDTLKNPKLKQLDDIRQKCRSIVGHFKSSSSASTKLADAQVRLGCMPVLKLKQEIITRWNSTLIMIERIVKLKDPIVLTLPSLTINITIEDEEWDILSETITILKPIECLTEELSGQEYMTASNVIPLVRGTQYAVQNASVKSVVGQTLKTILLDELSRRTSQYENPQGVLAKATILDPRLKNAAFDDPSNALNAFQEILAELIRNKAVKACSVPADDDPANTISPSPSKPEKTSLWDHFDQNTKGSTVSSDASDITQDLRLYMAMPFLDRRTGDALRFWAKHKFSIPEVADVAEKYLCVPATSVPSGRIFSKMGQIFSDHRSRLSPQNLETLTFVNANLKYI